MTERRLRLLLIEDEADDAELIVRALKHGGYAVDLSRVESEDTLRGVLAEQEFDLAMTDHALPGFGSKEVLDILAELAPDLPCLLVSGKVGEEAVGAAMRQGAVDYVAKDGLGRLPSAVERALVNSERRRDRDAAQEALARSGRIFEAVFNNARDAMLIVSDERRVVDANRAAAEMFALPRDELVELQVEDLMPEAWRVDAPRAWAHFLQAGEGPGEVELIRPDGGLVATEYTAAADFVPGRHIVVMRDIRSRRAADADARRHTAQQEAIADLGARALREESLDLLMEATVTSVATTLGVEISSILELRAGERTFVIQAATGLGQMRAGVTMPYGPQASSQASYTVGQEHPVLVADYGEETRFDPDLFVAERGVRSALSVEIPGTHHPYGVLHAASEKLRAFKPDDASFLTAVANILADALRRARSQDEMRELALHDSLTGLPNRTLFFDRLTLALARTKRLGTSLAVLFLDVDHFKSYNDTLGHRAADRLLTQIGARVERTMRDTDTVARFGGDEFVVLCEDLADEEEARVLTARLVSAFDAPFSFDDQRHNLSASIGVAVSDAGNLDGEDLLRDADIAMYSSKDNGRDMWTMATEEMRDAVTHRSEMKGALVRAIKTDELVLHYQPIVALDGGGICAVEALVRWEDPERGLIPPGEFIPLAEESGLILRLGEWVLRAACHQAALWRADFADRAPLPIHINVSARQVAQPDLPRLVREVLDESGVPPGDIALEITESALIDGSGGPMSALAELKAMGVSIVLDDFGTGYSSLSYLARFPIDVLKIDRAFVSQLGGPAKPAPIVTAIVGMARALAVGTVAEGVETAEQTAAVAALGCIHAQGYFFARPVPAERITQLVHDDTPLRERAGQAQALVPQTPGYGKDARRVVRAGQGAADRIADYYQSFLAALLAVDSNAALEIVRSALADEIGPATVDTRIIGAAMVDIGVLWERNEVSIAQEHLATGIASQAAGLAARAGGSLWSCLSAPSVPQTVLLANADGEDHVLGLRMVADILQVLGEDVRYLGSQISHAELCEIAAEIQPDVIGLSLTMPVLGARLDRQTAALQEICPEARFLLGGQGVSPELAERVSATYVLDVEQLVDMAESPSLWEPALTVPGSLEEVEATQRGEVGTQTA